MWPRGDATVGPGADMTASRRSMNSGLSGFVSFMKRKGAEAALRDFDGFDWGGSILRVGWSKAVPVAHKPQYSENFNILSLRGTFCANVVTRLLQLSVREAMAPGGEVVMMAVGAAHTAIRGHVHANHTTNPVQAVVLAPGPRVQGAALNHPTELEAVLAAPKAPVGGIIIRSKRRRNWSRTHSYVQ